MPEDAPSCHASNTDRYLYPSRSSFECNLCDKTFWNITILSWHKNDSQCNVRWWSLMPVLLITMCTLADHQNAFFGRKILDTTHVQSLFWHLKVYVITVFINGNRSMKRDNSERGRGPQPSDMKQILSISQRSPCFMEFEGRRSRPKFGDRMRLEDLEEMMDEVERNVSLRVSDSSSKRLE